MDYIKRIDLRVGAKLKADREYRNAYFRSEAADAIALQLRALRKLRGMNQVELANASAMRQSAISRIEQSEYSSWTFNTLWRVAEALDARVIVHFQPVEEAIRPYENENTQVPTDTAVAGASAVARATRSTGTYQEVSGGTLRVTKFRRDDALVTEASIGDSYESAHV